MDTCAVPDCVSPSWQKGLCMKHYQRARRTGSTSCKFSRGTLREKLDSRLPPDRSPDECWIWQGTMRGNYGVLKHEGADLAAHRAAFMDANGWLPGLVRHTCDVPACVNPAHLLAGDHASNMRDMVERGRAPDKSGRSNPNARYSTEQIAEVRRLSSLGYSGDRVAEATGVNRGTVYRVRHGQN